MSFRSSFVNEMNKMALNNLENLTLREYFLRPGEGIPNYTPGSFHPSDPYIDRKMYEFSIQEQMKERQMLANQMETHAANILSKANTEADLDPLFEQYLAYRPTRTGRDFLNTVAWTTPLGAGTGALVGALNSNNNSRLKGTFKGLGIGAGVGLGLGALGEMVVRNAIRQNNEEIEEGRNAIRTEGIKRGLR